MTTNLLKQLEQPSGKKLKLKINDNRTTMLSVRWEPDCTQVSLNRMFLEAPRNVMQALGCYLNSEDRVMAPVIKSFIRDNLNKQDSSHLLDRTKLITQGAVYDLQELFDALNHDYFHGALSSLAITWFGKSDQRNRSRVT